MTSHPPSDHFQGKSVVEHLKEARSKGASASAEIHGTEMAGHFSAGADAAKETALALSILWVLFSTFLPLATASLLLLLFTCGWAIWKTARSATLGWARIERLHRLIEEERWEIEHHRAQEREELTEMYRAKGLSGKLLEEVIDVLMADDNRLLRIMLEEELGLTLEAYEHPLKQALGALFGVIATSFLCFFGIWILPSFGLFLFAALAICFSAAISAHLERNRMWNAIIWNLSIACLTVGSVYFLIPLFSARG